MNFEIILTDTNEEVCDAFRRLFRHPLASVECGDMLEIATDAYVSPANSHGIMDGGLDRLLRSRFPGIESRVQSAIDGIGGLLSVGEALVIETDDSDVPYLICAPTMVRPSTLVNTANIHAAMLAILNSVRIFNQENDDVIGSIVIPGLGTGVGRIAPDAAAQQMRNAFDEFLDTER